MCNLGPGSYIKGDPPSVLEPFVINNHSITLQSIDSINENQDSMSLTVIIAIAWKDSRLSLKSDDPSNMPEWFQINDADAEDIFFPTLKINNGRIIEIVKNHGRDHSDNDFWLMYPNLLEHKQTLQVHVNCKFQFRMFPFDSQTCDLIYGDPMQGLEWLKLSSPLVRFSRQSTNFSLESIILQHTDEIFDWIELESLDTFPLFESGFEYSYTGMRIHMKQRSLGLLLGSFYVPTTIFSLLSLVSYTITPDCVRKLHLNFPLLS